MVSRGRAQFEEAGSGNIGNAASAGTGRSDASTDPATSMVSEVAPDQLGGSGSVWR